jgi:hypothetical protein
MSDNNTEALAQAFVKQTEVLVRKVRPIPNRKIANFAIANASRFQNILEFELRALLGTGMTADDIASFVKDGLSLKLRRGSIEPC